MTYTCRPFQKPSAIARGGLLQGFGISNKELDKNKIDSYFKTEYR